MSLFSAADACLSWSLPSITKQQVPPHRLSWNTSHKPTVFLIQQSCVITTFRC